MNKNFSRIPQRVKNTVKCGILSIIMRVFLLLISLGLCSVYANPSYSQVKIDINVEKVSLKELIKEIQDNSEYIFFYKDEVLNEEKLISLNFKNSELTTILNKAFFNTDISYEIDGRQVTIHKKQNSDQTNSILENLSQQKYVVTGVVLDETGAPLPGANILEKGTTNGTQTDFDGNFTITLTSEKPVLIASYIGYATKEIVVGSKTEFTITLEESAAGLEGVVVVGFGKQKEESVVSAVSTVKGADIRMPTRNLTNNIAGRIPGLIAIQRSGEPGYDNSEFWIRGVSSFAGGTQPLVLVDGIPRSMNDIDPDAIESFTLLKDAAATAVYGAEGANGVILITSKRGKNQKTVISYRGEYGISEPTRLPEFVGSVDFMHSYNEALINEGRVPSYSQELIGRYASGQDPYLYPDVQWLDLLSKTTNNTRHLLNFRGGGDRAKFFISSSFYNESGIFKQNPVADYNNNIGLNRYNLRSNVDFDVTPTTLLTVDLSGQYMETNFPGVGTSQIFQRMTIAPPNLFPMVFPDGVNASHPRPSGNRVNPYNLLMESGYAKEWRTGIQSKVAIEQDLGILTEGLNVRGVVSYDSYSQYGSRRLKTPAQFVTRGRDGNGELIYDQVINEQPFGEPTESNSGFKNIYLESSINYSRVFNETHDVGGMVLYYQKEKQHHDQALAFRKQAYVGRATYMYDRKYSLEVNFGLTGSESFAEGHRFGFFPAVGAAWVIDKEPFFKGKIEDVISGLKLRASLGRTGNDQTGGERFLYRGAFNGAPGYPIGIGGSGGQNGIGGLVEGRFASPALSWEIENKVNYGLDIDLFSNRINLSVNYFDNERYNILLQRRTVSAAAGFRQAPWQNFGKVSNKGFDGSLNIRENFNDLSVAVRGNITYAKNKIIEYDEVPQLYDWMNITGTSLNINSIYVAEGLYEDSDFDISTDVNGNNVYELKEGLPVSTLGANLRPGDIKYKDLNNDGVINQFDQSRDIAKPSVPELVYGVGLNVDYRNFYVNVFFQGAGSVSTVLGGQNGQGFFPFAWGVEETSLRTIAMDRWSPDNPSQDVLFPRLRTSNFYHNSVPSTWWLRDASFLRLKNVEIGWQLNENLVDRLKIRSARFYVMGTNLHVWDDVKFWDPEIGNANAGMNYPIPRNVTFGLDLKF
ncbi:TonB-dependent receptor [Arenibacter amylolyticus]|uniref:TonB-dependent receptor n=1 Tax=Arenibacter amylolyticus TaxID=1406873 RepID=UPI001C3C4801|nr:TonB-dependent receptor [Arenibacter amylolyticus]